MVDRILNSYLDPKSWEVIPEDGVTLPRDLARMINKMAEPVVQGRRPQGYAFPHYRMTYSDCCIRIAKDVEVGIQDNAGHRPGVLYYRDEQCFVFLCASGQVEVIIDKRVICRIKDHHVACKGVVKTHKFANIPQVPTIEWETGRYIKGNIPTLTEVEKFYDQVRGYLLEENLLYLFNRKPA
jgi:hypothetical protein